MPHSKSKVLGKPICTNMDKQPTQVCVKPIMQSLCNVFEFPRFSTYKISITPLINMSAIWRLQYKVNNRIWFSKKARTKTSCFYFIKIPITLSSFNSRISTLHEQRPFGRCLRVIASVYYSVYSKSVVPSIAASTTLLTYHLLPSLVEMNTRTWRSSTFQLFEIGNANS